MRTLTAEVVSADRSLMSIEMVLSLPLNALFVAMTAGNAGMDFESLLASSFVLRRDLPRTAFYAGCPVKVSLEPCFGVASMKNRYPLRCAYVREAAPDSTQY